VGTDAIPPHAGGLSTRLVLGPALRAQSDRRLVRLVREGYEGAFEEIVRRYRRPLGRFAASIVGGRHEDVTQDSFRKALEALRGDDAEIELRPWLYRIVRNTALNELRDRPPAAAELAEDLVAGTRSAAAEAESREEVAELIEHLRALPENQRAALLMRELDGMGHEEIATTLGISKGAARQAIARGRAAVRSGFGALLPMPLLRSLLEGGGSVEPGLGAGAASGAAATAIGAGGAGALKIGIATVVVAGGLGAGVALDHHPGAHGSASPPAASARSAPAHPGAFALGRDNFGELRTHDGGAIRDVADDSGTDDRSGGRSREDGDGRHEGDNRGGGRGRGHGEDDGGEPGFATTESIDDEGRGESHTGAERGGSHSGPGHGGDSDSGRRSGRDGSGSDGSVGSDGSRTGGHGSGEHGGHGDSGSGHGSGDDSSGSGGQVSTAGGGHGGGSRSGGDSGDDHGGGSHSGGGSGDGGSIEGSGGTPPAESTSDDSGSSSSSGGPGPSSESGSSSGDDDSEAAASSSTPSPTESAAVVDDSSTSDGGGSSGGSGDSGDSEIHP
jgi:RNA polymerase sigma factor (sigma-70 family)